MVNTQFRESQGQAANTERSIVQQDLYNDKEFLFANQSGTATKLFLIYPSIAQFL